MLDKKTKPPVFELDKYAPGIWLQMHIKGVLAIDENSKQDFIDYVWFQADTFPCENCRKHINEYIKNNPFTHLYYAKNNKGEEIGMFKWSWLFHNTVNVRVGKPYLDWNTAWEMYSVFRKGIIPCIQDCGKKPQTESIIQNYFINKNFKDNINKFL